MSLFARREQREFVPLQDSNWSSITNWSGEQVSETTALQVSAVMACVGLIADSVASLPIRAVRAIGERNEAVPLPALLSSPSTSLSIYELVHQTVTSLALYGNAYLFVDRARNGDPIGLTPIHPNNMEVTASGDSHSRIYSVSGTVVPTDNIVHIRWWTPPQALLGLSPVQEQKTTIGLAMAMERHLAQWYSDGSIPSAVLETDGDLTVNQAKTLQETWHTQHNRRRRPAVLTGGMRWKAITSSAADMELNASREMQTAQICRIFRVPAYLVGARGDSTTYSNAEMSGQFFVTYTLLPWIRRVEDALSSLLGPDVSARFDVDGFLRADSLTRLRSHQLAISSGIKTPNECRADENLEPYEGGDRYFLALPGAPMAGPATDPPAVGEDAEPPA